MIDARLTEDFQGDRYITGSLYFHPSNNTQGDRCSFLAVSIYFKKTHNLQNTNS